MVRHDLAPCLEQTARRHRGQYNTRDHGRRGPVSKNKAVIVENADHGTRLMESGEIVIMPYWNGRTVRLQEAKIPAAFELVPGPSSSAAATR